MTETKDKVVTVESLSALHEYNKNTYAINTAIQNQFNDTYVLNNYGTLMNSHDDLDDYTTPGIYYASDDVATTLHNCPTTSGFKMVVEYGYNENRLIQTIYTGYLVSDKEISVTYSRKGIDDEWDVWTRPLTNMLYPSDYGDTLPTTGIKGQIFFKILTD